MTAPHVTTPGWTVRPSGACDVAVMAAIHAEALANPEITGTAWSISGFAEMMAMPGVFGMILVEGDEPAGVVLARTATDEAEILTLGVRPSAQGRGAATALMLAVAAEAARRGAASLFLEVAEHNEAARRLYHRLGLEDVGYRPDYYRLPSGLRAAIVMRTALPL